MHKLRWLVAGLANLLLVGFAGCASDSIPTWAADACNIHSTWVASGRPSDDERRMSSLARAVPADENHAVAEDARTLVRAIRDEDRAAILPASEALQASCDAAGWQLPEG